MTMPKTVMSRMAPKTATQVDRLRTTSFVGGVPGLELRVSPAGARAWRLFYRLPGDTRRRVMPLGRYPVVSLAEARRRATEALVIVSEGDDPQHRRAEKVTTTSVTVGAALDLYLEHTAIENHPNTVSDKRRAMKNHVRPRFGSTPLALMKRGDWVKILDGLGAIPATRRSLYLYLHHFLGWAVERDMIEANLLAGIRPPRAVPSRDRVLSDDEIRAMWPQVSEIGDLARIALLTAQRRNSIASMRWRDIDFDRAAWVIPASDMKSGTLHEVPLSATALAIIERRPQLGGPYVFGVGTDGERPFNGFSNGVEILRRPASPSSPGKGPPPKATDDSLSPWRFHDLRRTAVTLAQRAGAPLDAIRALTQHKLAGIIGIYARHAYTDEKREVALHIEAMVKAILTNQNLQRRALRHAGGESFVAFGGFIAEGDEGQR